MNYLITALFPTANRADARTFAQSVTGVSHASAFNSGTDYTGGTASRVPVHLSVTQSQLDTALLLRQNSSVCKMIIRDSNWVVLYSDITQITVGQVYRDHQIQTAMQTTFTEGTDTPVRLDEPAMFGYDYRQAAPSVGFKLNKGIRVGGNYQDFSSGLTYRDSAGTFARDYLGYVRWPIHFWEIFEDPSNPDWSAWWCDRAVDWSIAWGVPMCFLLLAVPTDNLAWRTLAGHSGTALTNRDGSAFPSDTRYVRPEAALYPTIASCIETVIDRIAERYIANDKDPAEWMAIQWWNEPMLNNGTEPTEFNIMSNALVPALKTQLQGYGVQLWSPSIGGGQGNVSFSTAYANEADRFTPGGSNFIWEVFEDGQGETDPKHWQYYDALSLHSPYVHLGQHVTWSASEAATNSAAKLANSKALALSALSSLGYDYSSRPVHCTELGYGYDYWATASRPTGMHDFLRGRFIRRQVEASLQHSATACIYLLINANSGQDYPGTDSVDQWGIIAADTDWTKACIEVAKLSGATITSPGYGTNWNADVDGTDAPSGTP